MKLLLYSICVSCLFFQVTSCKQYTVISPEFEVTVSKSVFNTSEEIIFNITGNPDFLVFYSGEVGKEVGAKALGSGLTIKGMDTAADGFTFAYNTPGRYIAAFLGSVNNVYGKQEIVRTVELDIR